MNIENGHPIPEGVRGPAYRLARKQTDSDKFPDSGPDRYTFSEHRRYFDAM